MVAATSMVAAVATDVVEPVTTATDVAGIAEATGTLESLPGAGHGWA